MAMTPLERKAAFKAAVTLREVTMAAAAVTLGVSYNHLMLVLAGERVGSARLEAGIADFVGRSRGEMFQPRSNPEPRQESTQAEATPAKTTPEEATPAGRKARRAAP